MGQAVLAKDWEDLAKDKAQGAPNREGRGDRTP